MSHLTSNYARLPVSFTKGEGVWLWDDTGKRYFDALSGIAVCGLGHAHPGLAKAISAQASTLIHTSNLFHVPLQEALADKLCQLFEMTGAFFCNSGAEANEAAIKLARLYGHHKHIDVPHIIVMENSFHGRTMATLSATGNRKVHAGFEPLVHGFVRAPFGDVDAIKQIAAKDNQVVAILVEPIQGEGGINLPSEDYLKGLADICQQNDWLLMCDEVQTGIGRTGTWGHYQQSGVSPDVVSLAKGLGNGVPIGACLVAGKAADLFQPGSHGSTFGGNPLVCRAALEVLAIIEKDNLLLQAKTYGSQLCEALTARFSDHPGVDNVRGKGLMVGVELTEPCGDFVSLALSKGLIVNVTHDKVIRLLPPLTMTSEELSFLIAVLEDTITEYLGAK